MKNMTPQAARDIVRKEYRERATMQLELLELDMRAAELREKLKDYSMAQMMKRHNISEYALRTALGQRW